MDGPPPATVHRFRGAAGMGPGSRLLVLLALTGFAVTQPLLSVLGSNPTLFVFHRVTGSQLLWLTVGIAVVPPLVLWGLGLAASLMSRRLGRLYDLLVVGVLVSLTAVQWAHELGLVVPLAVGGLALVAGGGFAAAYRRLPALSTWLRFAAPLPAIAAVLFLFASPTSALLRVQAASPAVAVGDASELPPVVVVMLDELPTLSLLDDDDQIDPVRFPNLAAFAGDSTWYRHYTTLAPFTDVAVPSILTGRDPVDAAPLWTDHPDNLFSMLAPTHELTAFESLTYLCSSTQCHNDDGGTGRVADRPRVGELLGRAVEVWRDRVSPFGDEVAILDDFEEEITANPNALTHADDLGGLDAIQNRPTRLTSFLDQLGSTDGPSLDYLHLILPHHPWRFYADGRVYEPVGVPNVPELYPFSYGNDHGAWASAVSEQRHLLQAQFTDALLGEVFARLRATGRYDESLIVVTADHGASFLSETPVREITEENAGSVAYVPLLMKAPGQTAGLVDDSNLLAVDLVPTIAHLLGLEVPWETDGYPAGSREVAARGSTKYFYDFANGDDGRSFRRVVEFDDDRFPAASDRWIAPAVPGETELAGLNALLWEGRLLDRELGDLVTGEAGRAEVVALDQLRRTGPGSVGPGLVSGRVTDGPDDGAVVVAVNGTVVAVSSLYDIDGRGGYFGALLPSGALPGDNDVRIAVVRGDDVLELELYEP